MSNSYFDNVSDQEGFCMASDVFCALSAMEVSSFSTPYFETALHDGYFVDFQDHPNDMDITTENISEYLRDPILNGELSTDVSVVTLEECKGGLRSDYQTSPALGEAEQFSLNQSVISCDSTIDVNSSPTPLVLPTEDMEIDNELGVLHLLMAYAEAMEMGQEELAEVIAKRIGEKLSPVGDTLERLMYYIFQTLDKQSDYLKQESLKNFYQAFKAFYQIFPNGKFAHFVANLAILEALPKDVGTIRIFDFDIGEGIQWASLIGAIGHQGREVILTSIKFSGGESDPSPLMWRFEDTKKRLCDYSRPHGLKLKVEETEFADLACEIKRTMHEGQGRREWFVFNCMIGLPHMARVRSRKDVVEFLESAQDVLQRCDGPSRGIITFGDGDSWEKVRYASNYSSFLDGNMAHYQALLESIKLKFPVHLGDARTAMECLFVAPFVSSFAWAKRWEEKKKYGNLEVRLRLQGWKLSQDSLMEAKEVVREGESLYGVRIEGEGNNEMVMDWRGIPMVKVSCWRR